MKRTMTFAALGAAAMLSACGSGDRGNTSDIVTTNTGNVILNDAQQNYAFTGDNETVANSAGTSDMTGDMGGSMTGNTMSNGAMGTAGGTMTNSQ